MYSLQAQEDNVFNRKIRFTNSKTTIYEMLNRITEQSGFLFVYDSNLIDNEKKVSVAKGIYSLKEAILSATGEKTLQMKLVGQHILLYKSAVSSLPTLSQPNETPAPPSYLIVQGTIRDKQSGTPLPYSSVGVYETGIGTVANQNGNFILKLPDSLPISSIYISHLGYEPQKIPSELLIGNHTDFYLETRLIPLQEVIIRLVNPVGVLKEMLEKRENNYADAPVYFTSFYREGIEKRKGFMSLTEAVFKIYKVGYKSLNSDQVKLLKMRKINNEQIKDTLIMKMKAGIEASLLLDVVKNIPDFFTFDYSNLYNYSKIDMSLVDSHLAHVIAFEQKKGIKAALPKGEIYIDSENAALLSVRFEINPEYISKAENIFVVKKSKGMRITPKKAVYTVTYKQWNGKYYINHIRGDLNFKIKKRKQLFYSSVHTWFEMVTCKIDTFQVKRFPRKESLPINKVFSETHFSYDKNFWEDFNTILPEEHLNEAISKITSKIEEFEEKNNFDQ